MADQKSGTVKVGSLSDLITIGNGAAGTWNHGLGVKAEEVRVISDAGQPLADPVVTQPDANNIVATNGSGGSLDVYIVAVFQHAAIGLAGEVAASAVTVA